MKIDYAQTSFFGPRRLRPVLMMCGSLPAAALYAAAGTVAGPSAAICLLLILLALSCFAAIVFARKGIASAVCNAPLKIVSDEAAAMAATLLLMHLIAPIRNFFLLAAAGFVLFRLIHFFKLWPFNRLKDLPASWGGLAADLLAGVYAAMLWFAGRHLGGLSVLSDLFGSEERMSGGLAVFLGSVQGLTEFLPVSSSGHLVFFERFAGGVFTHASEMLVFDLFLHLGTVLSILVVFHTSIARFFRHLFSAAQSGTPLYQMYKQNGAVRFAGLALAATAATAIFYLLFKEPLEASRSLLIVALMWLVTTSLLWAADYHHGRKGLRSFNCSTAVLIGLVQGFAILPGISRSGATICAAILLGIKLRWAIEFSFLLSIPAILGGTVIQTIQHSEQLLNGSVSAPHLLLGMAAAFLWGVVSLKLLMRFSKKRKLKYFAAYCAILAIVTLIYCVSCGC